jgi:hypothetical protein
MIFEIKDDALEVVLVEDLPVRAGVQLAAAGIAVKPPRVAENPWGLSVFLLRRWSWERCIKRGWWALTSRLQGRRSWAAGSEDGDAILGRNTVGSGSYQGYRRVRFRPLAGLQPGLS